MSTLTGNQIKDTYQGLLKLADSSTGITTTAQAIQDGLGNDTGLQIGTNYFAAPNVISINDFKGDYYGVGFSNTGGVGGIAGIQNLIMAFPFYDEGRYSYSAYSLNVSTLSNTDTVELAFYNTQYLSGVGIAPYQQILSAHSVSVTSTGMKTVTFSSNLSFSATGGGAYFMVMKITNSGATPTVRITSLIDNGNSLIANKTGMVLSTTGNQVVNPTKNTQTGRSSTAILYSGLTTFQSSYSTSDIQTFSTTVTPPPFGFALHTVK